MSAQIRRHPPSVFVPVLLLLAGVLLLLLNLGALPEGAGWRLLLVSPIVLVMLGLQIVISRLVAGQAGVALGLAVIGAVGLLGLAYVVVAPTVGGATYRTTTSSSPVAGISSATLTVDGAGSRVSVVFGDTGSDLYRARLSYSGAAPKFDYSNGQVRIDTTNRFPIDWGRTPDQYSLTLSQSVPWRVVVDGAGTATSIEVLGGRLQSFEAGGAGSNVQLSLGSPDGTVPVRLSGAGSKLIFTVPAGVQYRATASGVAATVVGVRQSSGWTASANRYDIVGSGAATRIEVQAP